MNTAIVVGATGLVGQCLVERLIREECVEKVVAVTRRPVAYADAKVVNAVVDFDALDKHTDVFQGDVLFSCLGTTRKQAGSYAKQRTVDVDYQYLAAKISAAQGVQQYVLVSSVGADAKSKSPYLKMKGELEQKITQLPFKKITILQPSLLTGKRPSFRLGETLANGFLPLVSRLPLIKRFRPISGDEVAWKMVSVALELGNSNKVYRLDALFE